MTTLSNNSQTEQINYTSTDSTSWTNGIQTRILKFYENCKNASNYKTKEGVQQMSQIYGQLLQDLYLRKTHPVQNTNRRIFLVQLYKMMAHMRDIKQLDNGIDLYQDHMGHYSLAYMMVWQWYQYYPKLAEYTLSQFVCCIEEQGQPYGSWKDIKYMCNYIRDQITDENQDPAQHPFIRYAIELLVSQLKFDLTVYKSTDPNDGYTMSLAAKWVPRETSRKFGWLYPNISALYYRHIMITASKPASIVQAQRKCNTKFRTMVSQLNRHLDTVQIKQCSNKWADIEPNTITMATMVRQRDAFLNMMPGQSNIRRSPDPERVECAAKLVPFYEEQLRKLDERISVLHQKHNVKNPREHSWTNLERILANPRYKIMENYIKVNLL